MDLPIIYIRGYAGATDGINEQVEDPMYGFNKGTVHVRVGGDGDPLYYQFEGPLLRLITECGYQLLVHGDQRKVLTDDSIQIPAKSIWVHRFYDTASTTLMPSPHGDVLDRIHDFFHHKVSADGFNIEDAARSLYALIVAVLKRSGAPRVHVVAHSMGGLVARCMMQKICFEKDVNGERRRPAADLVESLFTYGTPHGGIETGLGLVNRAMEAFGPAGADIFAPRKMYGYLTPGANFGDEEDLQIDGSGWDPQRIPSDVFDIDRVFCLVGTDPKDYGLSRIPVGPRSDGLVRIEHAYVRGAHRAFAYKSHSGTYGEVNSEEGYQNLKRFLFGRWAVQVSLDDLPAGFTPSADEQWQADVALSIRGIPVLISQQKAEHWCPIDLNAELVRRNQPNATADDVDHPVPLMSTFLLDRTDDPHPTTSRYALNLKIYSLRQEHTTFDFSDHLEQIGDWTDSLIVDIGPDEQHNLAGWVGWASELPKTITDTPRMPTKLELTTEHGSAVAKVALPAAASRMPVFGDRATLRLAIRDREAQLG